MIFINYELGQKFILLINLIQSYNKPKEFIMKIFLVDDEVEIATVLAEGIELDYEGQTQIFSSLDSCLEEIDKNNVPDVIICDVHMPTGSGLRLSTELETRNLTIPHIFLTGMIDKLPPQKNAHMLRKPAPIDTLVNKIKEVTQ